MAGTLEQECTARGVLSQQSRTSFATVESQDRDLVLGGVNAAGHEELQHGWGAVFVGRFGDESLGRIAIGVADRDAPFLLQARDKQRQVVEPYTCADCERLLAHNLGNLDHKSEARNAEPPGRA
jgi:hypothetical protein